MSLLNLITMIMLPTPYTTLLFKSIYNCRIVYSLLTYIIKSTREKFGSSYRLSEVRKGSDRVQISRS